MMPIVSFASSVLPAVQNGKFVKLGGVSLLALTLAGCATFSKDAGTEPVGAQVLSAIGAQTLKIASKADAKAAASRVKVLLTQPLNADSAVQVALLSNRNLQAEYNALGVSEAAFVEASLPPNPSISLGGTLQQGSLDAGWSVRCWRCSPCPHARRLPRRNSRRRDIVPSRQRFVRRPVHARRIIEP